MRVVEAPLRFYFSIASINAILWESKIWSSCCWQQWVSCSSSVFKKLQRIKQNKLFALFLVQVIFLLGTRGKQCFAHTRAQTKTHPQLMDDFSTHSLSFPRWMCKKNPSDLPNKKKKKKFHLASVVNAFLSKRCIHRGILHGPSSCQWCSAHHPTSLNKKARLAAHFQL